IYALDLPTTFNELTLDSPEPNGGGHLHLLFEPAAGTRSAPSTIMSPCRRRRGGDPRDYVCTVGRRATSPTAAR
ncbi:hypothetical protein M9458_011042, partial [Cirrhinus mrigala]